MQASNTGGSKLEHAVQEQLDKQDQQESRKALQHGRSWLEAFLPAIRSEPRNDL